jgi:hypothetical protein
MSARPHNLTLLRKDAGYRWKQDEHSILHQARELVHRSELNTMDIWERVMDETGEYMNPKTIDKFRTGETLHPRLRTLELILLGLGKSLTIRY